MKLKERLNKPDRRWRNRERHAVCVKKRGPTAASSLQQAAPVGVQHNIKLGPARTPRGKEDQRAHSIECQKLSNSPWEQRLKLPSFATIDVRRADTWSCKQTVARVDTWRIMAFLGHGKDKWVSTQLYHSVP